MLIITGDAGEAYECLYARHRLLEEDFTPVIAAPSRRRLHLVMHDFEKGWDTYIERPGYGAEADVTLDEVRAEDYHAVRDGRLVTGQTWQSHPDFHRLVFDCLRG